MILGIQQSLHSEGVKVTMSQLCHWFELPTRGVLQALQGHTQGAGAV